MYTTIIEQNKENSIRKTRTENILYWTVNVCKFAANITYSSVDSSKCIQMISGVTNERSDLGNPIEEVNLRMIPHITK